MRHSQASVLTTLHLYASFALGARYADNQNLKVIDAPQVAANFPDIKGVTLLSPAFAQPDTVPNRTWVNATSGPTPQDVLERFVEDVSRRNKYITLHSSPDLVTEEGRSLPYLTISNGNNRTDKLRIWLQGATHGDEPGGDQGILALLGKFADNATWTDHVLEKLDFLILPRYNADGVAYFQRDLASNYDPNRDHAVLERQQTRDIKHLLSTFDPHIFVDAHEYTGVLPVARKYIRAQDLLLGANHNLNVDANIRALNTAFADTITSTAETYGLRHRTYFTTNVTPNNTITIQEPEAGLQSAHQSATLYQSLTFLVETRGIRLAEQHFQRRVATQLIVAETIINTAVADFDTVHSIIVNGRKAFTESREDIVLVQQSSTVQKNVTFIEAETGALVQVPVISTNQDEPRVTLTRTRPRAYVFSRAFSDIADRLRIFGVTVTTLTEDFTGTVEALTITSATLAPAKFEGIVAATLTTAAEAKLREVRIPKGGFWVSTEQKNAAWAFAGLEPEGKNSWRTYGRVWVERGDEWPIFRIV
ncbi:Zn-dependent exopeptidase [Byssothecium circinans]|uniref:Carboxypeptidase M14B n=1 Tax=Byssothecium circinans TaxID=147558 RepID=A0A6A5TQ59_9PLEO|nr:Zn-dependent exopeptidase [Byssothecium circinans]